MNVTDEQKNYVANQVQSRLAEVFAYSNLIRTVEGHVVTSIDRLRSQHPHPNFSRKQIEKMTSTVEEEPERARAFRFESEHVMVYIPDVLDLPILIEEIYHTQSRIENVRDEETLAALAAYFTLKRVVKKDLEKNPEPETLMKKTFKDLEFRDNHLELTETDPDSVYGGRRSALSLIQLLELTEGGKKLSDNDKEKIFREIYTDTLESNLSAENVIEKKIKALKRQ